MTSTVLLLLAMVTVDENRFDTVAICPTEFREEVVEWLEYRRSQGHQVAVIPSDRDPDVIREEILRLSESNPLKHVVIFGDAAPTRADIQAGVREADFASRYVPTFMLDATVNVHFGSTSQYASDLGYADLDGDRIPDLSIGRIPVDFGQQLTEWTERIIRYEQDLSNGYAPRRVNILAEPGNFGAIADSVLEMTARKFIGQEVPSAYDIDTLYASLSSPYCPDPRQLASTTLKRLNEGALFWVYIGHGQTWYLNPLRYMGRRYQLLDTECVSELNCASHPPIAVFFCCNTGAYDIDHDALAEELVVQTGGPIASLSASRVSMPFAMTVMADALLSEHFEGESPTLGELILVAKQRSSSPPSDSDDPRNWMFQLAQLFSPTRDILDEELLENVALFNLLGDPLLRMNRPESFRFETPERTGAGETIVVEGELAQPGRLTIELVYRRDRLSHDRRAMDIDGENEMHWDRLQSGYESANRRICRYQIVDLPAGRFEQSLVVPSYAQGACHVRAYVRYDDRAAIGANDIFVQSATRRQNLSRLPESRDDQR